jgi:hypothetical protein
MLYVEWCDLGCKHVGLKSFVVSIDYRDYMGSSSKIWALRCLFLYLCSYNLVGSVTVVATVNSHVRKLLDAWSRPCLARADCRSCAAPTRRSSGGDSHGCLTRLPLKMHSHRTWCHHQSLRREACRSSTPVAWLTVRITSSNLFWYGSQCVCRDAFSGWAPSDQTRGGGVVKGKAS